MKLSSPSCKTFTFKGIHLHHKSFYQWSQGSQLSMNIDARQMDMCTTALPRILLPIIIWPTIFSYELMLVINHAKCSAFLEKVRYTAYSSVDHHNMELTSDLVKFRVKEQVHVLLEAHQCSILNLAPNPSFCELSPWLRMSHWHELTINHIIP